MWVTSVKSLYCLGFSFQRAGIDSSTAFWALWPMACHDIWVSRVNLTLHRRAFGFRKFKLLLRKQPTLLDSELNNTVSRQTMKLDPIVFLIS